MIAIVNKSDSISTADARAMVAACAIQASQHFAPAYSRLPVTPQLKDSVPTDGTPVLLLLDDSDVEDALGYHTEQTGGRVVGIVAVRPILDNAGGILTGGLSVSSVLSHEVVETIFDPWVNKWFQDAKGKLWAGEVADPVQGFNYNIDGISVSDFVMPRFWDQSPPVGAEMDWCKRLFLQFSVAPGGYAVVLDSETGEISELGAKPSWRKGSRSVKRWG